MSKALRSLFEALRPHANRRALLRAREGASAIRVAQLMTRNPRTCRPDDTLHHAAQIMWETDCGCVPVVSDDGKVVAMITDRDVCMAAYTQAMALWQLPVSSAASRTVVAIRGDDSLESAEQLMRQHKLRRLPVLDGTGHPLGVLSLSDLARHARLGPRRGDLGADVARTLGAVCEPTGSAGEIRGQA